MELIERVNQDLKEAMRAQDDVRRTTLRMLLSAVRNAEIAARGSGSGGGATAPVAGERTVPPDSLVLDVLRTSVKQRREALEQYQAAKRDDLAHREEQELQILQSYLPAQLERSAVAAEVARIIEETGASGPADMRKVMPVAVERLRNRAEGRVVSDVVRELLAARVAG